MEEYICDICGLVSSDPDDFETDLCCGNPEGNEGLTCEQCYDEMNENL